MVRLKKKNLIENEKEIVSLNPKKLITHFYNKVDVTTAAIVIFISIFLETLLLFFLKVPNILSYFTIRLIVTYVFSWFVLALIIYLVLYFVKGRDKIKGDEFKKVLSSLAAFRIVSIITLLVVIAIALIFMPQLVPFLSMSFQNPAFVYDSGMLPSLGSFAIVGVILLILFSIGVVIYYLTMMYQLVKNLFKFEALGNILMTAFLLVIIYFFSSLL